MEIKRNVPTILVILGATGDLMQKKIVPALFNLFQKGKTPRMFKIVGLSRRDWTDEHFKESLRVILEKFNKNKNVSQKVVDDFINHWLYHQGRFDILSEYQNLAKKLGYFDDEWHVCSNKLFYIAAPPQFYEDILNNLHNSGLTDPCSPEEGFTRILIEKPFGYDSKTAYKLELTLNKLFKEQQIYRIDHYLAKENMQNILNFRFSNALFDNSWSHQFIEKIEIRLWEKLGVERRGVFYDGLGALRDVGQNHLLQMVALMTMDHPGGFFSESIRNKRVEILKTLKPIDVNSIITDSFRAQYEGYKNIDGVKPNSSTETFFKIKLFLDHPRWQGVPFILESGKRLKEQRKEIVVTFKHPNPCFCPPGANHSLKNKVTFQLEPNEGVYIDLFSKKPGLGYEVKNSQFKYLLRKKNDKAQYVEEYEKLLLDSILGDQTLFVRSDEVVEMWKFIDPIVISWNKNHIPLKLYKPDSTEPIKESRFIEENIEESYHLPKIKKEIAILGLGKMGANLARHLNSKNWKVLGFNRSHQIIEQLKSEGITGTGSLKDLVSRLKTPRILLLSLPSGKTIDDVLFADDGLVNLLEKGDTIIDGGNSFYKDSVRRSALLSKKGIEFIDVGISGGPAGALLGASLMIGGRFKNFKKLERLFHDMSISSGYQFFDGVGAGHFVKMVHNGIEYGMMQAIAEGFNIMKKSSFDLDLEKVAEIYNHGSVIESKLTQWLEKAFVVRGKDLKEVSGTVGRLGEGEWTVNTAKELGVKAKVIEDSLQFRIDSEKNPDFAGKILSAMREQFGGHSVTKK